ncbi:MAG: redoxin family protein [Armatimonadetes bacterium]|nr:redoxin family protein [Armatimonadota bacterium]
MHFKSRTSLVLIAAVGSVALAAASWVIARPGARSDSPAIKKLAAAQGTVEPRARDLMKKMSETYASAASLSLEIRTTAPDREIRAQVAYAAPNKLRIERKSKERETVAVSTGGTLYIYNPAENKRYIKADAHPSIYGLTRQIADVMGGTGFETALMLLMGEDLLPDSPSLTELTLAEPSHVEGVPVENVVVTVSRFGQTDAKITYSIGKTDHLLRKMVVQPTQTPGSITETLTGTRINAPLPASTFAYTPPAQAHAVTPPLIYHAGLKRGENPFPIVSKDMDGKPVSLDQYKGKVVLVNFWGTWCPACMAEMPDIIAMYQKYKGQGFDVLGVPLENDIDKVRVASYLERRGLPWRQAFEGKRMGNAIAEKYRVSATPLSILIGRDGKIAALDVRGQKEMDAAIRQALAQK